MKLNKSKNWIRCKIWFCNYYGSVSINGRIYVDNEMQPHQMCITTAIELRNLPILILIVQGIN